MAKLIKKENEPNAPEPSGGGSPIIGIVFLAFAIACGVGFLMTELFAALAFGTLFLVISIISFIAALPSENPKFSSPGKYYGDMGERRTGQILENCLPEGYTVIQNAVVHFGEGKSEIDNIVIGRTGVFIIEVKNGKGTIKGDYEWKDWIKDKTDRYDIDHRTEFYNPVKQVGTQIYRLANYLRDNRIFTNISGAVYFANPQTRVEISGKSKDIPVFTYRTTQGLIDYIMQGDADLSPKTIQRIIELLK